MNQLIMSKAPLQLLAVTGGHRVDHDAFFALLDATGARWVHAVRPGAGQWLQPDAVDRWDTLVLHDIAGLELHRGIPPKPLDPEPAEAAALAELLARGIGLVVLHHALASWPTWDDWATAMGGRFFYAPGELRGERWPSSGTKLATYMATPVDPSHPVCSGLGSLTLSDELYLCPVFVDEVVPLVRADVDLDPRSYISTFEHVIVGADAAPDCDGHPPGSDLIAWASSAGRSPIVYVQPGDSAATFADPGYRRLVANAVEWVASPDARAWAASRS